MSRNEKMCLRKHVFWLETQAEERALELTEQGVPMRAYQCPNCRQWHLTTQVVAAPRPFDVRTRAA